MYKRLFIILPVLAAFLVVAACTNPEAQLNITSDPPGANVYIDKAKVGVTPLRYNVVFNKTPDHEWERKVIEVRKKCYQSQYIFLKIDDSRNINFVLMKDTDDPECNKPPEPPAPPPIPTPPPPPPPAPRTP